MHEATRVTFPSLPPAVWNLISLALDEDLGRGDITSEAIFSSSDMATGFIFAKNPLLLSGLDVTQAVFQRVDPRIEVTYLHHDGDLIPAETRVMEVRGPARGVLSAERTALNFLQRLCGVATTTYKFTQLVSGTGARIIDTRKTAPGFRFLDKRAVRCGGGTNHRADLGSGILIKENHIAAAGGVREAIQRVRRHSSSGLRLEVEVTTINELREAVAMGAEMILLDSMSPTEVKEALAFIEKASLESRPTIEVSGGITADNIRSYAQPGVDLISLGALTHSVQAVDLSLEVVIQ